MDKFEEYIKNGKAINSDMAMYVANLSHVYKANPKVARAIIKELESQRSNLKMIASENYSSLAVQSAMGNLFTDKYAEGVPYHRFYAGCDNVDEIEAIACEEACKLFGAEHAYVQPHSGADANLCAYWAVLNYKIEKPIIDYFGGKTANDLTDNEWKQLRKELGNAKLLGLDYYSGGHLTHGYRQNISSKMFDAYSYKVNEEGYIDYDALEKKAMNIRPTILLAGYSAYTRRIDFKRMREIADKCGAILMVDMAHFAGLVAGKVYTDEYSPFPWADIVTTTTHKTLRGGRGGMVLCKEYLAESVDKGCPLVIGGPIPNMMCAKAVAFAEANTPEFEAYANRVVTNAKTLAFYLKARGVKVLTNGTDNHIVMIDVSPFGLNGKQAEYALRSCGITCNRNAIPNDPNGAWYTSGIRFGTPAITTLGMKQEEMMEIASLIYYVLIHTKPKLLTTGKNRGTLSKNKGEVDPKTKEAVRLHIGNLLEEFKVYPNIDLEYLKELFVSE